MEKKYTVELTAEEMNMLEIACGIAASDCAAKGNWDSVNLFRNLGNKLFFSQMELNEQ